MEDEDFLAAVEADNAIAPAAEPAAEPETPVEPTPPPPEPEPSAPAEPAQVPAPEPAPAAPEVKQPEAGAIPITALLDEREKRRAAEAELAQFRAQQQQPAEVPDRYEDPEGFEAYQQQQTQRALLNTRLDLSEDMARERHGDELVDKARDWAIQRFKENPAYHAEVLSKRNPYAHVVAEFQRHDALNRIGDPSRIDAFLAWEAAQAQLAATPPGAAPPPPSPAIPPRSLASAPSAGGVLTDVVQTDEEVFEETFARK